MIWIFLNFWCHDIQNRHGEGVTERSAFVCTHDVYDPEHPLPTPHTHTHTHCDRNTTLFSRLVQFDQIDHLCVILRSMALTTNAPDCEPLKVRSIDTADTGWVRGSIVYWRQPPPPPPRTVAHWKGHRSFLLDNANVAHPAVVGHVRI